MKLSWLLAAGVAGWAMTALGADAPNATSAPAGAGAFVYKNGQWVRLGAEPASAPAGNAPAAMKAGDTMNLGALDATFKAMDVLPLVKNEFSDRFQFDCFDDAKLQQLRKQEKLDEVVAPGKTDFDKQVLLLDWAHKRIPFGPPASSPSDALGILKAVDAGQRFNCGYYAEVLRAALSAMGYVARDIGLKGAKSDGNGSEHSIVEVWDPTHRKWVVLDPTVNAYFLKGETPLNAFEIRQEKFYNHDGKDLTIVMGMEGQKHTVADMPIDRGTHPGFGKLTLNGDSLGKFLYVAYTPRTPAGGPDYGQMFITKDKLCEGVSYHTRVCPKDPAVEPYWPMQQAALTLAPGEGDATVSVKADTMTPDFAKFRYRLDGAKDWTDGPPPAQWKLHKGENTLEARAVNKYGIEGAVSKVSLEVK
jgi:hypothetical protein